MSTGDNPERFEREPLTLRLVFSGSAILAGIALVVLPRRGD